VTVSVNYVIKKLNQNWIYQCSFARVECGVCSVKHSNPNSIIIQVQWNTESLNYYFTRFWAQL